jgi:hypothetical protein
VEKKKYCFQTITDASGRLIKQILGVEVLERNFLGDSRGNLKKTEPFVQEITLREALHTLFITNFSRVSRKNTGSPVFLYLMEIRVIFFSYNVHS